MTPDSKPTPSQPRLFRIRFSTRSMMIILVLLSICLSFLAYHLRLLKRQDQAATALAENDCLCFIGELEQLNCFSVRSASRSNSYKKYHYLELRTPTTTAKAPNGILESTIGPWFTKRYLIVWVKRGRAINTEKMIENLRQLPWLKCVVIENVLGKRGIVDKETMQEYETEVAALTANEIEQLHKFFPNVHIAKSVTEIENSNK